MTVQLLKLHLNIHCIFSSYPRKETLCILNIGDYRIRFRIRLENEIREVVLPIRQVQSWEIKTSSSVKKIVLYLKQVFETINNNFLIFTINTIVTGGFL